MFDNYIDSVYEKNKDNNSSDNSDNNTTNDYNNFQLLATRRNYTKHLTKIKQANLETNDYDPTPAPTPPTTLSCFKSSRKTVI